MTGILTPSFHIYYSKQLNQLPRSIKIDIWRRLTSRKHPLSLKQASNIHPEVEDLLNKAVENYIKKKKYQKMKGPKGTESISSDCETLLRQENEELYISKQVLKKRIEELLDLQEQYKSREVAMTRSLKESAIALAEKSINMLKNKCWHLEDIISAKDRKIIALVDQISSHIRYSDITIEPKIHSSTYERNLWAKRRSESEYDLEVQRKYTFRLTSSIALKENSSH
ncbi:hypothetical protein RhiirC2_798339 [Rhizophagus irregularis]|uniref:Uncharacterized protein n=1 Tax=Rhizophagus irregularis TaxID=588596 RepID=A0A2N1M6P4_9GLOM|nr:hypothetical protein RhiirC2_798339 [Rhizophagus irregularis]